MSAHDESRALHARARAFVDAFERGEAMPEPFDVLARDLARFQAEHVAGYGRLLRARGVDPKSIERASDAPAVPTDAFRLARVSAFAESETPVVFRTSGTTIGERGGHFFRDVTTYDAAARAFGRRGLLGDFPRDEPIAVLVVGPPPSEAPDSSLTHMSAIFVEAFGVPATLDETYFVRDGVLDLAALDERVARLMMTDVKALVLGTAFAYVHLLDAVGDAGFRLPDGSRVMQTGGFKGKTREIPAEVLRRDLARAFAIPEAAIVGEYGMTELSSQFYEATGVYREPPWARVVPVDPESLTPVPDGAIGIARICDLMNVDSAFAVLANDRVRRVPGGFELLGRAAGAPPRGCSIAIDELLGG